MRWILFILLTGLLMSSDGCSKNMGGWDSRLKINNLSGKAIYYAVGNSYPDTLIPGYPPLPDPTHDSATKKIPPNAVGNITILGSWESRYEDISPSKKLVFFIFDSYRLETTNWDTIRSHNLFLKRFDLSLDSIKKMNWIITYH